MVRRVLLGTAGVVILLAIWFLLQRPSNDRAWQPGLERLAQATFAGDLVTIDNVRDFRVRSDGTRDERWDRRTYDLSRLDSLWYVLSVFDGDGWRGPAHGMLSFGFDDGRYLVVSVEARKEIGESYSVWKGLLRRYEMMYVMGDERDLVLDRCANRGDEVYLYPVQAEGPQIRKLLEDMLRSANALRRTPRFYNTLTNNCTSRLRDHVNAVYPDRIPPTWKVILPGFSDELLRDLDLLRGDSDLADARRIYRIEDRAARIGDVPEFSASIRRFVEPAAAVTAGSARSVAR